MRRLAKLLTIVPVMALTWAGIGLIPHGTHAFDGWCFDDPVVQVEHTVAAINVGIQGAPADVDDIVRGTTVTIYVPDLHHARVLKVQNGALKETVRFLSARDDGQAGTIDVTFDMVNGSAPRNAAVQVTANGVTNTVVGTTNRGLETHFTVQSSSDSRDGHSGGQNGGDQSGHH